MGSVPVSCIEPALRCHRAAPRVPSGLLTSYMLMTSKRCLTNASNRWKLPRARTQMLCRGVGTGMGARGCGCVYGAGARRALTARCSDVADRPTRKASTMGRGKHIRINPINTIISLKSGRQSLSGGAGIPCQWFKASASRSLARPPRTWARGLSCWQPGGIDLPATLLVGCGLNSRQINHLQCVASETHYRGQSASGSRYCKHAPCR